MQKILIVLGMVLSQWHSVVVADTTDHASLFFTQLYTNTCVKNSADMQALKENFSAIQTKQLPAAKAVFFLENKQGTVWIIPNVVGNYLVSIDSAAACAVYTHNVNINAIERQFITLLEKTPSAFLLEKVQDETPATPLGPAHFIRYLRTNKADNSQQEFSLQTSIAQGADIQAKAMVGPVIFVDE